PGRSRRAVGPRSCPSTGHEQMTSELSATQVEEDALKVSAEIGALRIDDRRPSDRIHRLALMNVAVKTKRRLNILDNLADVRRTFMLDEDMYSHYHGFELLV